MEKSLNLFLNPTEETSVFPIENKNLLNFCKGDLSELASQIIESVTDGNADALDVLIMAKKGVYAFESIVDGVKDFASIPEKNYSKYSVVMREQNTGVRYYFDGCNDPEWTNLNIQMIDIKERMKAREDYLKSFDKPIKIDASTNEDTGEVIDAYTLYPAVKSGSPSLVLTLK